MRMGLFKLPTWRIACLLCCVTCDENYATQRQTRFVTTTRQNNQCDVFLFALVARQDRSVAARVDIFIRRQIKQRLMIITEDERIVKVSGKIDKVEKWKTTFFSFTSFSYIFSKKYLIQFLKAAILQIKNFFIKSEKNIIYIC